MGTENNQVSVPIRSIVNDPGLRVTLFHDFTCLKAYFSKVSTARCTSSLAFFSSLLFHLCDVRDKVGNHVHRDITANWLDYVQHSNLRPFVRNCLATDCMAICENLELSIAKRIFICDGLRPTYQIPYYVRLSSFRQL